MSRLTALCQPLPAIASTWEMGDSMNFQPATGNLQPLIRKPLEAIGRGEGWGKSSSSSSSESVFILFIRG